MSKHIEKLKTGDPNRTVTDQEFLNVMGEFLEESIEYLREAEERIFKPKEAQKPPPKLSQRLMSAVRQHWPFKNATK